MSKIKQYISSKLLLPGLELCSKSEEVRMTPGGTQLGMSKAEMIREYIVNN